MANPARLQGARRFAAALACCVACAANAAISSVAFVQPVPAEEGAPLGLTVQLDQPVCIEDATPEPAGDQGRRLLQMRQQGNTLSLVLAVRYPTGAAACTLTSTLSVRLPALLRGQYLLRVGTASRQQQFEVFLLNQTVDSFVELPLVVGGSTPTPLPVYLIGKTNASELTTNEPLAGMQSQSSESYARDTAGDAPAFHAWQFWGTFLRLLTGVFWVPYATSGLAPSPVYELVTTSSSPVRYFYTINEAEQKMLVATGHFKPVNADAPATFSALSAVGSACPLGSSAVYRAFDAQTRTHRFVQHATYMLLIANGWSGEGIAFCGAPESANTSGWEPN